MYDFLTSVWMHDTCICIFGSLAVIDMGFSRCDSGFSLALPFLDSHGVLGFFYLVDLDCRMVLKLSGVVSRRFTKDEESLDQ